MKTNKMKQLTTFIFMWIAFTAASQDWNTYPYNPSGQISFPSDEGRHATEPVEWWYTTGHVTGNTSGTEYSYMVSYFYYPAAIFDGFRILTITNHSTGNFYENVAPINFTSLSTTALDMTVSIFNGGTETWANTLDTATNPIPFQYNLDCGAYFGDLDLHFEVTKRPLILDDDGYMDQGASSYTYYYSFTGMEVTGSLTLNGTTENVTGSGWLDRQYGNFNPFSGEKYEWFSMQLSNGMDINLWNIFTEERTIPDAPEYRILSAYVDENNQYTEHDFEIERLQFNCMPDELMCYSKQWHLTSTTNNIDLIITSLFDDSELDVPFRFFEVTTTITGTVNGVAVTGVGFAELLHGYEDPMVTLDYPVTDFANSNPLTWTLDNPDEGRPIYYNIAYSLQDDSNFISLVDNLQDTSYEWTNPDYGSATQIYFKLQAQSIDGELFNEYIEGPFSLESLSQETFVHKNITVYPNPTKAFLNIEGLVQNKTVPYEIHDVQGRCVLKGEMTAQNQNQIDVTQLNSGLYLVKFNKEEQVITKRIMKL